MTNDAPLEIDHVIVKCKGCGREREHYPDRPLRGAEELIAWMKSQLFKCTCGATHCDIRAHIRDPDSEVVSMVANLKVDE